MGRKLPQITAWLNSLTEPFSLLCFQEFPAAQIASFQKHLIGANYDFRFALSFERNGKQYGELTLFEKETIRVENEEIIKLGTSFAEQYIMHLHLERTSLLTQISYKKTSLVLVNTHLIAYASNKYRRGQLRKVLDRANAYAARQQLPVLVIGDMNYSSLLPRDGLFALIKEKGYTNGFEADTHALFSFAKQQIDYIFYKNCTVQYIQVLQHPFSDHKPITFRF